MPTHTFLSVLEPSDQFISWFKITIREITLVVQTLKENLENSIAQRPIQQMGMAYIHPTHRLANIENILNHVPSYLAANRNKFVEARDGIDQLNELREEAYRHSGYGMYDRVYKDITTVNDHAQNYMSSCDELYSFIQIKVTQWIQKEYPYYPMIRIQNALDTLAAEMKWWHQTVGAPLQFLLYDRFPLILRHSAQTLISGSQFALSLIASIIGMFIIVCATLCKMILNPPMLMPSQHKRR